MTVLLNNQQFLRYNKQKNWILMFTLDECLKQLATSKQWNFYGTFKITPKGFYQVVSIQTLATQFGKNHWILCVEILMSNKERATYEEALDQLLKLLQPYMKDDLKLKVFFLK